MSDLILNADNASLPVIDLLRQATGESVRVCDENGKVLAIVLSPDDHEAWAYAEARGDLPRNHQAVAAAMNRSDGVTTAELLSRAAAAEHDATS